MGTALLSVALGGAAADIALKPGSAAAFVLKPARAAVNAADTTPPLTMAGPGVSCVSATTATLSATIDEAGTGYYLVQPAATAAPSATTVMQSGTSFSMGANATTIKNIAGLAASTSYKLYFVAKDAAGNAQTSVSTATPSPFITTSAGTSITATSIGAEDGYVYASSGGTPAVGTNANLRIGRYVFGLSYFGRAVLSFDTKSIPDCATITRAYVTVAYSFLNGDPWANPAANTLEVDVKKGSFGAEGMEATDWAEAPTALAVATIAKFTGGTKASTDFNVEGLEAINKTGKTQIKLRFSSDQSATNYIDITSGTATLYVEYTP